MCKKIVRILAWFLAAVLAPILLLAAAIRVDQYVLRYRAERLQSDIRSLELRKSTFADARRLEDRWFDNTKEKACRPSWCDLDISLNNTSARHLEFLLNHLAVRAIYHSLGGRVAGAYASIQVRDNVLWGKGIGLGIETLDTEPDGRRVEFELVGRHRTILPRGTGPTSRISNRQAERMHELRGRMGQIYSLCRPARCFAPHRPELHLHHPLAALHRTSGHSTYGLERTTGETAKGAEDDPKPCTPAIIRSLSRRPTARTSESYQTET